MWEEQQRKQGSSECKTGHALNRKHVPTHTHTHTHTKKRTRKKKCALEWSGPTHIVQICCLVVCTSKHADKSTYCAAQRTYHTAQVQEANSSSSFNIHHTEKRIKYKLGRAIYTYDLILYPTNS